MSRSPILRALTLALAFLILMAPQAARAEEDPAPVAAETQGAEPEWEVEIEPALWLPTMDLNLGYGDRSVGFEVTPQDLKGSFQFGGSGRIQAMKGDWGFEGEGMYVNLADDVSFRRVTGSVRANTTLVQGMGIYRVQDGEVPVDVLFGARYYSWNVNTSFTRDGAVFLQNYENSRGLSWADPVIGARTSFPLSDCVRFGLAADIGGFGLGSDFSWKAGGRFDWSVSESTDLVLGYTALGADYRRGSGFDTTRLDFTMYGPILGASFKL